MGAASDGARPARDRPRALARDRARRSRLGTRRVAHRARAGVSRGAARARRLLARAGDRVPARRGIRSGASPAAPAARTRRHARARDLRSARQGSSESARGLRRAAPGSRARRHPRARSRRDRRHARRRPQAALSRVRLGGRRDRTRLGRAPDGRLLLTLREFALLALFVCAPLRASYTWLQDRRAGSSLEQRIPPPEGFRRTPAAGGSFAAWLRGLPLRPEGTPVRLFDGREKGFQAGAFAVVDIDVGSKDLQQCADAVIRLRAEYLFAAGCDERITFDFTSGHPARWSAWKAGLRPAISGNEVSWVQRGEPDPSYARLRRYLDSVFTYAGSRSLSRDLEDIGDPSTLRAGDVFIQGGSPGHAVLVVDVAEDGGGRRRFLLAQSYMPAQDVHVLRNPKDPRTPWYPAE